MHVIEIEANELGGHNNQSYNGVLPDGWALIREDVSTLENFPFGEVTAEEVNGVMTMTSWTPGEMPEPEPIPEPEEEMSVWDELDAAYQEGVNAAYEQ